MTNEQRIAEAEKLAERAKSTNASDKAARAWQAKCNTCRWREFDWNANSRLCDCENPLIGGYGKRVHEARGESGLCGPDALFYAPSRNPFRYINP